MKTIQPRSPVLTSQRTLENKTEKFTAYNTEGNTHEPCIIDTPHLISHVFTHIYEKRTNKNTGEQVQYSLVRSKVLPVENKHEVILALLTIQMRTSMNPGGQMFPLRCTHNTE